MGNIIVPSIRFASNSRANHHLNPVNIGFFPRTDAGRGPRQSFDRLRPKLGLPRNFFSTSIAQNRPGIAADAASRSAPNRRLGGKFAAGAGAQGIGVISPNGR
jgi:hypothetical protein